MSFSDLMAAASSNASAAARFVPRTVGEQRDRFLSAYRSRTPPPGIEKDGKKPEQKRPIPKNLLPPPKAKPAKVKEPPPKDPPPPAAPSLDKIQEYVDKKLREKARLIAQQMEQRKREKERLLKARVAANDGKLSKRIQKQMNMSTREAESLLPPESARLSAPSSSTSTSSRTSTKTSSSSKDPRREAEDSFRRRQELEERERRLKEQEEARRKGSESRATSGPKPGPRCSKPSRPPPPAEPAFQDIMKLAQVNHKKAAASGFTRTPSPPPVPPPPKEHSKAPKEDHKRNKEEKMAQHGQSSLSEARKPHKEIGEKASSPSLNKLSKPDAPTSSSKSSTVREKPGPMSAKLARGLNISASSLKALPPGPSKPDPTSFKAAFSRLATARAQPKPTPSSSSTALSSSRPGPLSSKTSTPSSSSSSRLGPLSSKKTSSPVPSRPGPSSSKSATAQSLPSASSRPGPKSSKSSPSVSSTPSSSRPGPMSFKSSGSVQKPSQPSLGKISAAGLERLKKMKGGKMSGPPTSTRSESPGGAKPSAQDMAILKARALKRSLPAEGREKKVPRRPLSPPPSHQPRSKYSYSNVGGPSLSGPVSGGYLDDEEEDSELEDFIDDTPLDDGFGDAEISKTIKEVFRYDKRMYAGEKWSRDDDRSMQSSYKDIQKEEIRSAKIAQQEDLAEFLKEQERASKKAKR